MGAHPLWLLAPLGAIAAIAGAWWSGRSVLKAAPEEGAAQAALLLDEGSIAWIRRQGRASVPVLAAVFLGLAMAAFASHVLPLVAPFAFMSGAIFSGLCGYLGSRAAAGAAPRTARAARESTAGALGIAVRASASVGLLVVGLGLLDISAWFAGLYWLAPQMGVEYTISEVVSVVACLVLGSGITALLGRLGAGLFSGATEVGAEMLARAEAGIPEDDPRNPAVSAARISKSSAGAAGLIVDLYGSHMLAVLVAAALGAAAFVGRGPALSLAAAALPAVLAGTGALLSMGWVLAVPGRGDADAKALRRSLANGVLVSAACLALLGAMAVAVALGRENFGLWGALVAGLAAAALAAKSAEYGATADSEPVRRLAAQSEVGIGGVLVGGMAAGLRLIWLPVTGLAVALLAGYYMAGGALEPARGLYGVALVVVGVVSLTGITATAGAFAPIVESARDCSSDGQSRERVESILAMGGTFSAMVRLLGAAAAGIGTLAAVPVCLDGLRRVAAGPGFGLLGTAGPMLMAGAFLGVLAVVLLAALMLSGAARSAIRLVEESRRQWKTLPGLAELKPEARADCAACVNVAGESVNRQVLTPIILALAAPLVAGLLLGPAGTLGMLAGVVIFGIPVALFSTAAGGAWEAACWRIEGARHGGRGSLNHRAAVVGRMVGAVLRDLVGPGFGAFMKLIAVTSVVAAGLTGKLVGAGCLLERCLALLGSMSRAGGV